ncbi:endolytic transglycosylase MltG [Pueribacillus sp. YX66]|uniref:endolytic transglycosylase MltG n=1 Tax=Pueribacillus sp. YX66 TaxID=3229242 RepID=UPI00358D2C80
MTKNGLRGFAAGLIIATFILSYVYYFQSDRTDASQNDTITESDIENYALEHDLVILTEEEFKNLNVEKEQTKEDKKKEDKKKEDKKEEPKEEEEVVKVNFEISPGMSTDDVASKLHESKLIKKKSDFTNYIKKNKLESAIKAESYKLNSEMTVEEIAKIVTK